MPFEWAAREFEHFTQTHVSPSMAERVTEMAGAVHVANQTEEVSRIEKELPPAPEGPAKQFLSVDGAMVPLVGGEWAEVKTLVIGEVMPPVLVKGEPVVHTVKHSYFSRLTNAEAFRRLALVETHRRGVETAQMVGAVTDGSEWIQAFVDFHRVNALRILDFPHAGEHLNGIGQAIFGEGSLQARSWLDGQLHQLKHTGPTPVLAEARRLISKYPNHLAATHLAYLEKREAHMQYPAFLATGWPIGDGAVESANKLVVEKRLKGSGMHWARSNVDPMLALRNIACNDRWEEAWPQIMMTLRLREQQRRVQRRQQRRAQSAERESKAEAVATTVDCRSAVLPTPLVDSIPPTPADAPKTKPTGPYRPPPDHPWRHMPIGRARFKPPKPTDAKL